MASSLLDSMVIASPCTVEWSSMRGSDRVRRCTDCKLDVFNISQMTTAEAEALIRGRVGRLCVRLYRRADGTVLTSDCPAGEPQPDISEMDLEMGDTIDIGDALE